MILAIVVTALDVFSKVGRVGGSACITRYENAICREAVTACYTKKRAWHSIYLFHHVSGAVK